MMPAYRNMDSYPYQRNQMPLPHFYHPGIEAVPPQIRVDPSKPPFSYEQFWPYGGNYGHPIPSHFCCGHNNFPGYYNYRPSYPHAPAPSPIHCSGGCPAYGEPFFVPYSPQPHYIMELPRYEHDKYMPRDHHCCGCPNHPCNQKEGNSVKIEEQEPCIGKKVNDALVPIQLRNYPYPIVWIPPEYASNRQPINHTTAEEGEQNKISHDRKPPGPGNFNADVQQGQEPRVWNGWLPFDMKGTPNMVHDGDGTRSQKLETDDNKRESEDGRMNQKQQSDYKRSEFPFPIIWLPYYNKQEEGGRINNQENNTFTPKCIEEVPHTFKSVPVKSHVDEGVTNKSRSNEVESTNTSAPDVIKKVTNERSIPVKQMELHQGTNDSQGSDKRELNIPVSQMEENETKKDSDTSGNRRSTSPKGSKLPPVCLRVDPLPRKKNGKGSSRSPSPPASKEHSQATAGETSKTPTRDINDKAQPNSNVENAPSTSEKVKPKERTIQVYDANDKAQPNSNLQNAPNTTEKGKPEERTIQVYDMNDKAQPNSDLQNAPNTSEKVKPKERTIQLSEDKTSENKGAEDKKAEEGAEDEMEEKATELKEVKDSSTPTDEGQKERRVLSDADAAVLIQAAYRGYQVRKWEPLKKLRQIAEVRKEVTDVRGQIQAFEGSSDLQNDDKQKIAIGETIMRLLLKLDTIQGLHPSFREIRKSLARELVTLQERLDSIMAKKPQQQMPVEVTPLNKQNGEYQQEQEEEKVAAPGDSSEGIREGSHDTLEKCQDQFCMKDDINNLSPTDGGSESQSPVDPTSHEGTEPVVLPNSLVNEEISPVVAVDALVSTSGLSETDKMAVEHEVKSEVNNISMEVDKLDMTALKELPVGVVDEDIDDISSRKDNPEIHLMKELPVGVLDEDMVTSEFGKHDETNISKDELQAENEEYAEELAVGLLNEDTAKSEFEKHDESKTYKAEEEECNADEGPSSSTDDTAKETQMEQPEEQEEVQSSGESDGWVKIEFQKEDELKGDAPLEIEESREENRSDTKLPPSLTTQVNDHNLGNEEVCLEANDVTNTLPEPMEFLPTNDLQKEEKPQEKLAQWETQVEDQEMVAEQTDRADDEETENLVKEENELSAASPAIKELPVAEHDGGLNGDAKLVEENEKLRKVMKELLEAGNEQLSVISDLMGRVKDLEKKLARNRSKRVRTKRYRPATSKMSSMKSSK